MPRPHKCDGPGCLICAAIATDADRYGGQITTEEAATRPWPGYTDRYIDDAGETRIVDPTTGGEKGSKLAQLGNLDPAALLRVAEVAGFGAIKYERLNFTKGYAWSLSFDALQRHLLAFWNGNDIDDESGLPHLAHAAWHCLALLTFSERQRGSDDRLSNMPHMRRP